MHECKKKALCATIYTGMKDEKMSRIIFSTVMLGIAFSAGWLGYVFYKSNKTASYVVRLPPEQLAAEVRLAALPARLRIPSLSIDSPLEYLGITEEGKMDVPKELMSAGWFAQSVRPGELGNALLTGHVSQIRQGKKVKDGIFDNLRRIKIGDEIIVEDEKGETHTFAVREVRKYDPDDRAEEVFIAQDGKAHLNLITCEGEWDPVAQSYTERLVVFADKI